MSYKIPDSNEFEIKNGKDLESYIATYSDGFSVPGLLQSWEIADNITSEIADTIYDLRVRRVYNASLALNDPKVYFDNSNATSINSALFSKGGAITIDDFTIQSFSNAISQSKLLGYEADKSEKLARNVTLAYTLGSFVSKYVYKNIQNQFNPINVNSILDGSRDKNHKFTRMAAPINQKEIKEFIFHLAEDSGWDEYLNEIDLTNNKEILTIYSDMIRPERFYARGGLETLDKIDSSFDFSDLLINKRKQYILNTKIPNVMPNNINIENDEMNELCNSSEELSGISLPNLDELGAIYPLSQKTFKALVENIKETYGDIVYLD